MMVPSTLSLFLPAISLPAILSLAALDDILEVVVPIIFMILYFAGQLLAGKKQARQRRQQPAMPPLKDGLGGQDADKPPGVETALRREVDEFLRRARGGEVGDPQAGDPRAGDRQARDRQARNRASRPQPQRHEPQRARKDRKSISRQGRKAAVHGELDRDKARGSREGRQALPPLATEKRPFPPAGLPSTATQAEPSAGNLRSQSVAAHVEANVGRRSRTLGQHAERLADSLEQTDERTQRRIEQKFDHQVGRLQQNERTTAQRATTQEGGLAEEIADLLRSPEGMRQLIIANEILKRPSL